MFKRGNIWWYEIKLPTRRIQSSTGLKDRKMAEKVYRQALCGSKDGVERSVVEKQLARIYAESTRMPMTEIWTNYMAWYTAKGKSIDHKTMVRRKGRFDTFVQWCSTNRVLFVDQMTVSVARQYIASLEGANKTVRLKAKDLSTVWTACSQEIPGLHNPWPAACPSDDGSAEVREPFTADEARRVIEIAKESGHEWYGMCITAKWTGQRYGDCATLEFGKFEEAKAKKELKRGAVDVDTGVIVLDPQKTRRHGTRLYIPIAKELATFLRTLPGKGLLFPEHAGFYERPNGNPLPFPFAFSTILELANVDTANHTFHSWRHTLRSNLAEACVPDSIANRFGGWKNPKMGSHYDHSMHLDEMREALGKIK